MLRRSSPQLYFAHRFNAIAYQISSLPLRSVSLPFHCSDTLRFSLAPTRLTLPSNSYAYQHTDLPWRFLSCLFGSLASHITPMPCPGISIPVTALPSLRLSVQCHRNPGLSLRSLCTSLLFHSVPFHLRTVICFATAYLRHTFQCHRMTHHCNQSLCAVRLHTSTPLHRTLRYTITYHAVPLPLLVFRYYAFANYHGSAHCRAVALHSEPSLRSATLRLAVSLLSQQSHSKSPPRKAVAIMRFFPTGISPCLNSATDQVHGVFHNQATHGLLPCPNPPDTR